MALIEHAWTFGGLPQDGSFLSDQLNEALAFFVQAPYAVERRRQFNLTTNQQRAVLSRDGVQGFVAANSVVSGMRGPLTTALRGSAGNGSGDFTVLVYAAPDPASPLQMAYSCAAGTGIESYFFLNGDDTFSYIPGSVSFTIFDSGVFASNVIDGRAHVFVARRSGSSLQMWVDGRLAGTATKTTSVGNASNSDVIGGYFSPGYGCVDPVGLVVGWNRALPEELLRLIGANPGHLFEEQRLWIPTQGVSSTPTLSNLRGLNITQTGFQPAVDYTY